MKERGVELDKLKIKVDDLDAEIRSTQGKLQKKQVCPLYDCFHDRLYTLCFETHHVRFIINHLIMTFRLLLMVRMMSYWS